MAFRLPAAGLPNWRDMDTQIDRAIAKARYLDAFTAATLPSAADYPFLMVFVTDEAGGAQPAVSDGTNWRRLTDRAIVS